MRRLLLLLLLPIVACNGLSTPLPGTPPLASASETSAPPTAPPPSPSPTQVPPTETPSSASTFPDPNAYTWQLIASDLERPVDLQDDGSGRLFILEKLGHIHV